MSLYNLLRYLATTRSETRLPCAMRTERPRSIMSLAQTLSIHFQQQLSRLSSKRNGIALGDAARPVGSSPDQRASAGVAGLDGSDDSEDVIRSNPSCPTPLRTASTGLLVCIRRPGRPASEWKSEPIEAIFLARRTARRSAVGDSVGHARSCTFPARATNRPPSSTIPSSSAQ